MESVAKKAEDERRREEEIRKQIAALQALLPSSSTVAPPASPKQQPKRPREITLAPATPSPKKKRKTEETRKPLPTLSLTRNTQPEIVPKKPAPSNLLSKLSKLAAAEDRKDDAPPPPRSSSLTEKAVIRDENLAIIEDFEPGPYDHTPPFDDPNFDKLEPNSGIRLSSRSLPHEDLQEHLTGRYYLSPSRLYSCVRLTDKHGYDVPVGGDWLTIAVVAERGPVKHTKAPVPLEPDDDPKGKGKRKQDAPKPSGKKYVVLKLVDFGTSAKSKSSATGSKAVIRGDACLSLLLFESDSFDTVTTEGSSRTRKVYKGGSGGAFESMSKCKEGDVIVVLNPRIMKPNQGASNTPHPLHNILGLTPESAESITVIGRSADLGLCAVTKRDNSRCNAWYDRRVSQACDYHVQETVKRQRASRPEFSIGTTGMSNHAKKRKAAYDPARQWGMKPEAESNSTTYVVSGHIVGGYTSTAETMGREAQAKAQRVKMKQDDKMLKSLLDRDKDGMKTVIKAREFMEQQKEKEREKEKGQKGKGKGKEKEKEAAPKKSMLETTKAVKNSFSAEVVKQLGFDPTAKPGQRREDTDVKLKTKLDALSELQLSRKNVELGRRPGTRAPVYFSDRPAKPVVEEDDSEMMVDLDSET